MEPGRSLFAGMRIVMLGNATSKALLIAFEFALAGMIGAAGFGLFSVALATLMLLAPLTLMGLNFGVIQHLARFGAEERPDKQAAVIRTSLAASGFMGLLAGLALIVASDWLAGGVFAMPGLAPLLVLVGCILPLEALNQCLSAVFRGYREYRRHNLVIDLLKHAGLVLALPFVWLGGLDLGSVFLLFLGVTAAGTVYGLAFVWRRMTASAIGRGDGEVFAEVMRFSAPLALWGVMQAAASRVFVLIAGVFLLAPEVGVLALALRLVLIVQFVQTAANMAGQVEYAKLWHAGNRYELESLFRSVSQVLLILAFAALIPLVVMPGEIMGLFGGEYAALAWVLPFLALRTLVNVGTGPIGQVLIACRERGVVVQAAALDAALQFGMVVPLLWAFGVPGLLAGEIVRVSVVVLVRHWAAWRRVGIVLPDLAYGFLWLVGLLAIGPGALIGGWFGAAFALGLFGVGVVWVMAWTPELEDRARTLARMPVRIEVY